MQKKAIVETELTSSPIMQGPQSPLLARNGTDRLTSSLIVFDPRHKTAAMRNPHWRVTTFALCLCVLWLGETVDGQGSGTKARLTSQQAISIRRLRDLRWSPKETWVAFTVS